MPATRKKPGTGSKPPPPKDNARPIRREAGALICFALSVLTFLGLFGVEALLIDPLCSGLRAMVGWGFVFVPFVLLISAVLLFLYSGLFPSRRGKPVMARVICCLTLPVLMGVFYHLLRVDDLEWGLETVRHWMAEGREGQGGGLLGGGAGQGLRQVISTPGTVIFLLVGVIIEICVIFRLNPAALYGAFKNRSRPEYAEPEDPDLPWNPAPAKPPRPEKAPRRVKQGRSDFDIPIRDEPDEREPVPAGAFPLKPDRVKTPAEALTAPEKPVEIPQVFTFEDKAPVIIPEPLPPLDPPPVEIHQEASAEFVIEDGASPAHPYRYPPVDLLSAVQKGKTADTSEEMRQGAERLVTALGNFSIGAHIANVTRGPSVTRYEIELEPGVRLSSLQSRADDIALSLGVASVGIAPVTGKLNVVGIEVPNKLVTTVYIRELIEAPQFQGTAGTTSFALGRDIAGNHIMGDLKKLVHLLVAGTTGSGKSVCINTIIISLLYKASPDELKFIMVDPKMVELGMYNGIPHLLTPVVSDSRQAAEALDWAVLEMDNRYKLLMEHQKRDIDSYNASIRGNPEAKPLPRIVVVIDEMADLMMVAKKEVETAVARIAQKARACGVHLILATQRPEAKVVTGIIKANIPSRIALSVRSALDSRIMLDEMGAEKLIGKGDMLFLPNGAPRPTRVQGCWVSDGEVTSVVSFLKEQGGEPQYSEEIQEHIENAAGREKAAPPEGAADLSSEEDSMLPAAIDVMIESGQGSVSYLQRRLKLGYARAARLMDMMEERGIVGPFEGSKPRQVLITPEDWARMNGEGAEL